MNSELSKRTGTELREIGAELKMKAVIKHDIPGRMRIHFNRKRFSYREADTLQY